MINKTMEEILELKQFLLKGDLKSALLITEQLEEMSKKDIINNIRSFAIILLLHLIKQEVENRTTRSWDMSIRNSILEIKELNKRPKSRGFYLDLEDLEDTLTEAYTQALNKAALEVLEGAYEVRELKTMVNQEEILDRALAFITTNDPNDD